MGQQEFDWLDGLTKCQGSIQKQWLLQLQVDKAVIFKRSNHSGCWWKELDLFQALTNRIFKHQREELKQFWKHSYQSWRGLSKEKSSMVKQGVSRKKASQRSYGTCFEANVHCHDAVAVEHRQPWWLLMLLNCPYCLSFSVLPIILLSQLSSLFT